jgi:hypothetical protein
LFENIDRRKDERMLTRFVGPHQRNKIQVMRVEGEEGGKGVESLKK